MALLKHLLGNIFLFFLGFLSKSKKFVLCCGGGSKPNGYRFGDDYPPKVVYFKGCLGVHRGTPGYRGFDPLPCFTGFRSECEPGFLEASAFRVGCLLLAAPTELVPPQVKLDD